MSDKKSVFDTLSAIDVSNMVETKNNQKYLSWAHAWGEVKKRYPDATYSIVKTEGGDIFRSYKGVGLIVETNLTILGETLSMWLPVMDHNNKPMMEERYTFKKAKWISGKKTYIDEAVEPASIFDVNTAIMRCLTKNIAMFGLGLNIYSKDEIPAAKEEPKHPKEVAKEPAASKKATDKKPALNDKHENWEQSLAYAKANSEKGLDFIIDKLRHRFTISATTKDIIKKHIS